MRDGLHNVSYPRLARLTNREGRRGWRVVTRPQEVPAAGIYAIYHDGRLVYIGSSSRLRHRMSAYLNRRKASTAGGASVPSPDVQLTIKVSRSIRLGDWLMREYRLIQRLRPRDNSHFSKYRPFAKKLVRVLPCLGCDEGHVHVADLTACEKAHGVYGKGMWPIASVRSEWQ